MSVEMQVAINEFHAFICVICISIFNKFIPFKALSLTD